jgi:hypothetical protein
MWKSRNAIVFGSTLPESHQSAVRRLLAELQELHSHLALYRPCDVSYLMSPVATDDDRTFNETIRRQGVSRVQDWLKTWKPYFCQSRQRAAASASASSCRISDHFPVLHHPVSVPVPNHPLHLPLAAGHGSSSLISDLLSTIVGPLGLPQLDSLLSASSSRTYFIR